MRILTTGANGFLGSAFCATINSRKDHLRVILRNRSALFLTADDAYTLSIGPNTLWLSALQDRDVVVHLAARAHVMHEDANDPLQAYRSVNTDGTLNLARQAAAAGIKRFVFLSSVKVNGEATILEQPFTETNAPHSSDPYAISKWEAEQGLRQIASKTGMEVVIIRPPLVYGPGVKANFAALLRAVARGMPLPLGAVHNLRSLVGLDNLVSFIHVCMTHSAAANQTFLVSDGEDLSTPALVRRMAQAMGRPARLLPVPPWLLLAGASVLGKHAAVQRLCGNLQVDIRKARDLLGWTPPVSVDEGLRRTVAGMP